MLPKTYKNIVLMLSVKETYSFTLSTSWWTYVGNRGKLSRGTKPAIIASSAKITWSQPKIKIHFLIHVKFYRLASLVKLNRSKPDYNVNEDQITAVYLIIFHSQLTLFFLSIELYIGCVYSLQYIAQISEILPHIHVHSKITATKMLYRNLLNFVKHMNFTCAVKNR